MDIINHEINDCMITLSTKCQLGCPTCKAGRNCNSDIKNGFMSRETFLNIMEKVPFVNCKYHNWGEPFLHKDIIWFIEEGAKRGKDIELHSNMQIMNEDLARGIVEGGLRLLSISCDGTTQDTYEKYRVGGSLEKLTINAQMVANMKKKVGKDKPNIKWQMVVNKYNQHQVDEFGDFAKKHGADCFAIGKMYSQTPHGFFIIDDFDPHGKYKSEKIIGTLTSCIEPTHRFVVDFNGDVYTCCNSAGSEEYKMGNINDQNFEEIWYGEKYQYARRFCLEGGVPEDNGFNIQCHACFNKFPNKEMYEKDRWHKCLEHRRYNGN